MVNPIDQIATTITSQIHTESEQSAQATSAPTSGYGVDYPYGNIQGLVEELAALGSPFEYKLIEAALLGQEGIGDVSTALDNLLNALMAMVKDPTSANCQAFYDDYQKIYSWTQDNASNPIVQKVDALGSKLGWSSTQEQNAITQLTGKATDLLNNVNKTLNGIFDPLTGSGEPISYYLENPSWSSVQGEITNLATTLSKDLQNPQANPSVVNAYQSGLTSFSDLIAETTSKMSATVVPEIKLAAGQLQSLISAFGSFLKMEGKQYQSQESNMPGASGG